MDGTGDAVKFQIHGSFMAIPQTIGEGAGFEIERSGFESVHSFIHSLEPSLLLVTWSPAKLLQANSKQRFRTSMDLNSGWGFCVF